MRIPGTRRSRLLVLLALGALTAVVGLLLYARARALYRNLGPLVVAELQRQLGREVAIGRLDVHRPGLVVMDRVAVAANRRLAQGALLRAKRVVIRYSWLDVIWFRSDVVGSVRQIDIQEPSALLVRGPTGRFNVQDLFKPRPGARPTTFRARIVVTRGQLLFQDYKAALAALPAVNQFGNIDGVVDYRTFPRITAQVAGAGRGGRVGPIQANTLIDNRNGGWLLRAYMTDADAAYWTRYLARTPAVQVRGGRGNVDLVVSRTALRSPLEYVVNLAARGVDAKVVRLAAPLQAGRGVAQITPFGVKLEASGQVAGMPVQASGNILDWKHPQVAISFSGSGITLAAVRRVLPQLPALSGLAVTRPGVAQAWLLGPANRLYASGTVTVPAAAWRGEVIRDARVAWRLHAGMLELDRVTAFAARGGTLDATGWAQLTPAPASLYLTGQLSQVNLAGLPGVAPRTKIGGLASARFAVSGTTRDLHGGATVQLSRLFFNTARLNAATARLDYQDGVLYVRSLQAADPRGRLVAAGTVGQKGDLHLQVRAKGINLAALLAPFTKQPASGIAYFAGGVGGTVRDPRLAGQLQVYAGRLGTVSTDYAEGQIVVRPDQVQAEPLVMRIYPGQVAVRGVVGGWREAHTRLDLHATASDLNVARLLAMAGLKTRAAGTVSGDLTLQGTPAAPVATASLQVDDLLVEGARLGSAKARLEADGRRLLVRQASVQGDALAATAQGSIGLVAAPPLPGARSGGRSPAGGSALRSVTKESPLDLTFAVQRLDLARAASRAGGHVVLQGIASATGGTVRGRLGAPVVTARVEAAPIAVNTVAFAGLSGSLAYTPGHVTLRDVELRDTGGTVRVTQASLQPLPKQPLNGLTVDATVTAFPIQEVIDVAQRTAAARSGPAGTTVPPRSRDVSGPVSGTITARPETSRPGAPAVWTVALSAPKLTVPGYRVPPEGPAAANPNAAQPLTVGMKLQASYRMTGLVTLEGLEITRDEGILQARGSMVREGGLDAQGKEVPDGEIILRVDASDIPLSLFGPLAPALHPLRGTGVLHLDAAGPLRSPAVQGSLDVEKPVLAGVPFAHFSVPFIQVAAPAGGGLGNIQVQNARLEQDDKDHPSGQHYLLVDGRLPFLWESQGPGTAVRGRVPANQPLSLTVRLPEQSLDVLNTLSKLDPAGVNPRVAPVLHALGSLSAVSGTMAADLKVTGTREQPNATGSFQIANGAIQPQQGETRFENIGVRLGFSGNRVDVEQLEGRSSNGGNFVGSGSITGLALGVGDAAPAAQLDLRLALNDFRYTERNLSGYLQERFRGTLRTVERGRPEQPAPLRLTGDWRTPTLSGALQVRSARLGLPASLPESRTQVFIPAPNPRFQLDVLLDRDVWLENPRIRMQMNGLLPVRGTLAQPSIIGTLIVQRGTMTFPTARFKLEGSVDVAYAPGATVPGAEPGTGGPAPLRVDLTATARVRGSDPRSGQRQRYDVTLVVQGPLTSDISTPGVGLVSDQQRLTGDRLTIEARSDPPLSEQEILALLGRGASLQGLLQANSSAPDILRREVGDVFTASVLPTLFVPVETAIADYLGLEDFSIDFAFQEPVQIGLTKKLYGPLFATYTYNINYGNTASNSTSTNLGGLTPTTALNLWTLEFYYRISNRLRFGYRLEEPSNNHVLLLNGSLRF